MCRKINKSFFLMAAKNKMMDMSFSSCQCLLSKWVNEKKRKNLSYESTTIVLLFIEWKEVVFSISLLFLNNVSESNIRWDYYFVCLFVCGRHILFGCTNILWFYDTLISKNVWGKTGVDPTKLSFFRFSNFCY